MESKIETPYLDNEVQLRKISPFHVQIALFNVTAWKYISHHPTCSQFREHLFKFGKLYLCVGCTMMYSGIALMVGLFYIFNAFILFNPWFLAFGYYIGIGIALSHLFVKPKKKGFKALFRLFLGLGLGSLLVTVIIAPMVWQKLLLIGLYIIKAALYGNLRKKNSSNNYCETCPLAKRANPCNPERNTAIKIQKIKEMIQNYKIVKKTINDQEDGGMINGT